MTEQRVRDLVTPETMLVIHANIDDDSRSQLEINVFHHSTYAAQFDRRNLLFAPVVRDEFDTPQNPHIVQIMGGMPETFDSDTVIQFYDDGAVRFATVCRFEQKPSPHPTLTTP